jgi:hypothetical protein
LGALSGIGAGRFLPGAARVGIGISTGSGSGAGAAVTSSPRLLKLRFFRIGVAMAGREERSGGTRRRTRRGGAAG